MNKEIRDGIKDGLPIGAGYFAVAFSLGIIAKSAGVTPVQGFITSFLNHASAGEYAIFTSIKNLASYIEIALMVFVANVRYVLMSCALSQKISPNETFLTRFLVGFTITDEIFACEIGRKGFLDKKYTISIFLTCVSLWALGTALGCIAGNILPSRIVSALSVALYGMFIAIVIPAGRKERKILGLIAVSFGMSFAASCIPVFKEISSGTRIIVLTILISSVAAILFPRKETEGFEENFPDGKNVVLKNTEDGNNA